MCQCSDRDRTVDCRPELIDRLAAGYTCHSRDYGKSGAYAYLAEDVPLTCPRLRLAGLRLLDRRLYSKVPRTPILRLYKTLKLSFDLNRYYFKKRLSHVVEAELQRAWTRRDTQQSAHSLRDLRGHTRLASDLHIHDDPYSLKHKTTNHSPSRLIRPDMVRRVDVAPRRVNPMGMPARTNTVDSTYVRRRAVSNNMHHVASEGPHSGHEVGFGGFPGPREVFTNASRRLFPGLHRQFQKTLTMPRTSTLIPSRSHAAGPQPADAPIRPVPYLSFPADVGKNSSFKGLGEEEMLELGGVEYSALNALMWIVPLVSMHGRHRYP